MCPFHPFAQQHVHGGNEDQTHTSIGKGLPWIRKTCRIGYVGYVQLTRPGKLTQKTTEAMAI